LNVKIQLLDRAKPFPKFHQLVKLLESLGEMSTKYKKLFITKGWQLGWATITKKIQNLNVRVQLLDCAKSFHGLHKLIKLLEYSLKMFANRKTYSSPKRVNNLQRQQ
jgi:hypothetical protein